MKEKLTTGCVKETKTWVKFQWTPNKEMALHQVNKQVLRYTLTYMCLDFDAFIIHVFVWKKSGKNRENVILLCGWYDILSFPI